MDYKAKVLEKYPDAKACKIEDTNLATDAYCIEATRSDGEVDAIEGGFQRSEKAAWMTCYCKLYNDPHPLKVAVGKILEVEMKKGHENDVNAWLQLYDEHFGVQYHY